VVQGTPALAGSPLHPAPITQNTGSASVLIPTLDQTIAGDPNHINVLTSVQFLVYMAGTANLHAVNNDPSSNHGFTSLTGVTTLTVSEIGGPGVTISQNVTGSVIPPPSTGTPCVATIDNLVHTFACEPVIPAGDVAVVDKEQQTTTYSYSADPSVIAICGIIGGSVVTDPPGQPSGTYCQYAAQTTFHPVTNFYTGNTVYSDNHLAPTTITSGLNAFQGMGASTVQFVASDNGTAINGVEDGGTNFLSWGGNGSAGAILEVTYTFDIQSVPEPTTMVLIGSSMLGLGLMLRRRRSRKP
jgi:hypothetical protein